MRSTYGRIYNFGRRLIVRRSLGIETKEFEELLEPIPVDEFIALNSPSTDRFIPDNWR